MNNSAEVKEQELGKFSYEQDHLYIGGEWVKSRSHSEILVRSPATEEVIGRVPGGGAEDIERAVVAARRAFDGPTWSSLPMAERAHVIDRIAEGIARRRKTFAEIFGDESGQPVVKGGLTGVDRAVRIFRYYASLARKFDVEELRDGLDNPFIVRKEPVGVVAIISPWNSPLSIASFSVPAALASGCTIVLKPAPESPLHAQLLAEVMMEAEVPAGVFNVVPADRIASESLVRSPLIDKVTFTGSSATGKRVGALCSENLTRFTLELGGKSAAVLLDDVDLESCLPAIVGTAVMNSGQACVGQTRILVPRSRYEEISEAFVAVLQEKNVGDPHDPDSDIGPMISEQQRARVEGYIEAGRREGGRVLLGGGRPEGFSRGWYVSPTVFGDVSNVMRIAREEIFGPVVCLIPYQSVDEAVAIANDSDYGLSGTVWTSDLTKGLDVARGVRAGNYGINMFNLEIAAPFGGFKQSGIGRQLGPEGIEGYMETKAIQLRAEDVKNGMLG